MVVSLAFFDAIRCARFPFNRPSTKFAYHIISLHIVFWLVVSTLLTNYQSAGMVDQNSCAHEQPFFANKKVSSAHLLRTPCFSWAEPMLSNDSSCEDSWKQKAPLGSTTGRCNDVLQDHGIWLWRNLIFGSLAATYKAKCKCAAGTILLPDPWEAGGNSPEQAEIYNIIQW